LDSLTQIVLGAAVGEAVIGKKVGNKAILWGAVAGTIPDLDVLSRSFMDVVDSTDFHRGFSHSIVFCLLAAPILGWLLNKLYQKKAEANQWQWTQLAFWCFLTHPLLDCFTTWGTQLFWPLEHRVAIKSIFVVDPLYTIPFLIFTVWLMFKKRQDPFRTKLNKIGLTISSAYLLLTLVNKQMVNSVFEKSLEKANVTVVDYESRPTPFNNILWAVTAETKEDYKVGYYSFLDSDKSVDFLQFNKQHELLAPYKADAQLNKLLKITDGYYTVEELDSGYLINDLRFGQAEGWQDGTGSFVFAFEYTPAQNEQPSVFVQRPRTSSPDQSMPEQISRLMGPLWERVKGK